MENNSNKRDYHFENVDKIEIYSEPVREILSKPPKWIIRYGIGVIFIILLLIIIGSYFIKYPDIVHGKIVLISKSRGQISVPIKNLDKIKEGQIINIKFENYPSMEYGIIQLRINNLQTLQEVNNDSLYFFEIFLPDTLITSYGKRLNYIPRMRGKADIIVQDLRLIDKFIISRCPQADRP